MALDIDQIAGLRAILDDHSAKLIAAYNPANKPVIADITGLTAALTAVTPIMARGAIAGCVFSTVSTVASPSPTFSISSGMVRDSTNTADIVLSVSMAKTIAAAFAAGAGNGSRSGAAYGNLSWFHVFLVLNPTSGAVDIVTDQSATNPNLPTGFTKFRRLCGIMTDAAGNVYPTRQKPGRFFQKLLRGVEFVAQASAGSSGSLRQLQVPRGVKYQVMCIYQSTSSNGTQANWSGIYDPDDGPVPTFGVSTQWALVRRGVQTSGDAEYLTKLTDLVWTDTNGQVAVASNDSSDVWALGSIGYYDRADEWGV